jgi:hypothetical protein
MKPILPALVGVPLLILLGLSPFVGLADQAAAASKERGYKSKSSCHGKACPSARRATRPSRRDAPRGYLPSRKGGSEYDFPSFGSQRWWQQQEDED